MSEHWILKGHEPVPASLLEWANWFEKADRSVAQTQGDGYRVSTVFLGLDHRFCGDGPPLLFETMVFSDDDDEDMSRYSTWDEAIAGHERTVAEWRERKAEERGHE